MLTPSSRPADAGAHGLLWDRVGLALLAVTVAAVLGTFADYGITWDEPLQSRYGALVLDYYRSGGADRSVFGFVNLYLYGAAFDLAAAVASLISPLAPFDTRHLLNALVGLAGLVGVWRLARALGGPRAGALALGLLALSPDWYGHMFNNPKDIPFAAAMTWGVLGLVRLARELPRPSASTLWILGLATGLALGTRVAGGLLVFYLGILLGAWGLGDARLEGWRRTLAAGAALLPRLLAVLLLALGLMLLLWPWTQQAPLANPLHALGEFSRFPFDFEFLFDGETVRSGDLPWYYLPLLFLLRLPEPVLLGLAVLPLLAIRAGQRPAREWAVLGLALLFPPLYILAGGSVLYDGLRHALFLLPLLVVAGSVGLDRLWRLGSDRGWARLALLLAAGLWLGYQLTQFVRLHPHQYVLFNRLAGGVEGAAGRFELDYWGNSLKETSQALLRDTLAREGPGVRDRPVRVAVCGPADAVRHYLPPAWGVFEYGPGDGADLYLKLARVACSLPSGLVPVADTRRLGVSLSSAFRAGEGT